MNNYSIVNFIKVLGIGVVSMLTFIFIFKVFNNTILNPFKKIQKITRGLKHKDKFYALFTVIAIVGSFTIKEWFELSDLSFGILFGFLYALNEVIFEK